LNPRPETLHRSFYRLRPGFDLTIKSPLTRVFDGESLGFLVQVYRDLHLNQPDVFVTPSRLSGVT